MSNFLTQNYKEVDAARQEWLDKTLEHLKDQNLKSVLDLGCGGGGFFAEYFTKKGYKVTGVDLQECNINVCQKRCPQGHFELANFDGDFPTYETHDLCLMFGLLYHLQSPFKTVTGFAPSIGKIGMVSSVVAPGDGLVFKPYYEYNGDSQNMASDVSLVPTEKALYQTFTEHGFHVYSPPAPNHPQWTFGKGFKNAKRVSFVVSRKPLNVPWEKQPARKFYTKWS